MCNKLFSKEKKKSVSTEIKKCVDLFKENKHHLFLLNYIELGKIIDHRIKNVYLNAKFMQETKNNAPALL